jgi:hypothetical protein
VPSSKQEQPPQNKEGLSLHESSMKGGAQASLNHSLHPHLNALSQTLQVNIRVNEPLLALCAPLEPP